MSPLSFFLFFFLHRSLKASNKNQETHEFVFSCCCLRLYEEAERVAVGLGLFDEHAADLWRGPDEKAELGDRLRMQRDGLAPYSDVTRHKKHLRIFSRRLSPRTTRPA